MLYCKLYLGSNRIRLHFVGVISHASLYTSEQTIKFVCTLRCLIDVPCLLIFLFFSKPQELIGTHRLLILQKMKFYILFPFFVSTIQVHVQGKIACFCS